MKSTLTVALRDGRIATTVGSTADDLLVMGDFIAAVGFKASSAEWTISAATGPDYTARYEDIASVDLRVEV